MLTEVSTFKAFKSYQFQNLPFLSLSKANGFKIPRNKCFKKLSISNFLIINAIFMLSAQKLVVINEPVKIRVNNTHLHTPMDLYTEIHYGSVANKTWDCLPKVGIRNFSLHHRNSAILRTAKTIAD
jgi:hypothetical protein